MSKLLNSEGFNCLALTCSSLYFIFFVASLGCIVSGQCNPDGNFGIKIMKIITLILPVIYFAKLTYGAIFGENNNYSIKRFQLGLLLLYFFLVFMFLCADIAGDKPTAQNVNTLCIFILPIFIILSFYSSYQQWQDKGSKYLIYLGLSLSMLYYCLFYFSLMYGGSVFGEFGNSSINGVLMAIGILLIFQFMYGASMSWNRANLKYQPFNTIYNGYYNTVNSLTKKVFKI